MRRDKDREIEKDSIASRGGYRELNMNMITLKILFVSMIYKLLDYFQF